MDKKNLPLSEFIQISRREFVGIGLALTAAELANGAEQETLRETDAEFATPLSLTINGETHTLNIDPRTTLLDLLRENLRLTGTKKGCDHGQCGACTVLANGKRVNSCLTLAVMNEGSKIMTIEGLGQPDHLHAMQQAFIKNDGLQCGYCTPGQICSAVAMLEEAKQGMASAVTKDISQISPIALSDAEIRERMSGNICRCGAYVGIVAAIRAVHQGESA